jgi:hypothetical protein
MRDILTLVEDSEDFGDVSIDGAKLFFKAGDTNTKGGSVFYTLLVFLQFFLTSLFDLGLSVKTCLGVPARDYSSTSRADSLAGTNA